jgi:hypothetical protein
MSIEKDYLEEDELVDNKKFCCVSVVSPDTKPQCNTMCLMIRGGYSTIEEAKHRTSCLEKNGNKYPIWIGPIGFWVPLNFNKNIKQEEQLSILNLQMKQLIENKITNDDEFVNRKSQMKQNIDEENKKIELQNELELSSNDDQQVNLNSTDVNPSSDYKPEFEPEDISTDNISNKLNNSDLNDVQFIDIKSDDDNRETLFHDDVLVDQRFCCISFISPTNDSEVYGLKIRAIFENIEDANEYCKKTHVIDIYTHIYVAEVGKWLEWEPDAFKIDNQVYPDEGLNDIIQGKKKVSQDTIAFKKELEKQDLEQELKSLKNNEDGLDLIENASKSEENKKEIINTMFD